ncbi:hypothetical protein AAFC00_006923 [Neodothiora populina]|uniref:Glycosyltransferase 2 n=1 Tax=Neodothiora populina TaxID=2781224 RepID=A0ABR3PBL9_9PEZI
MPQSSRMFPGDEELGKRSDDRRPPSSSSSSTQAWRVPVRWRRRRILLGLVAVVSVWLFIHNIPTDLGSIDERMGRPMRPGRAVSGIEFGYKPPPRQPGSSSNRAQQGQSSQKAPTGAPPRSKDRINPEEEHYYWGPVKFYNLASTLHAIPRARGRGASTRNVLFAASSLKSFGSLLPMACEMQAHKVNLVHIVLLGRDSISMDELLTVNGVDKESCNIGVHDGRPDYSDYSSDVRAEVAVAGALSHINTFMSPRVIITDDSAIEDAFFTRAIRGKAKELDKPIIEIPDGMYEDFLWMTRLDCDSLQAWHKPNINIVIHAPPHSSGSLLRLLESLKGAEYTGLPPPHLTIDLPTDIEPFARDRIRDMTWPPDPDHQSMSPRHTGITLHHRISSMKLTTESNAVRLLEAFYPADPAHSHVLLLSPQTDLSPLYYHYLFAHLLEYRYSSSAPYNDERLMGIALGAPQYYLNGSSPFVAPSILNMNGKKYRDRAKIANEDEINVPYIWQAPNAEAALIFGDKWAEFHDYLKNRLRAMHEPKAVYREPVKPAKVISETQPGWLEYMLELMRARGWGMLYPPAPSSGGGWATVHQELYQLPEEFAEGSTNKKNDGEEQEEDHPLPDPEEPFLSSDFKIPSSSPRKEQRDMARRQQPLHAILPLDGDLPEIIHLPYLSTDGNLQELHTASTEADRYKQSLRQRVGGCDTALAALDRPVAAGKADDLFCFLEQDLEESVSEDAAAEKDVPAPPLPVLPSAAAATAAPAEKAQHQEHPRPGEKPRGVVSKPRPLRDSTAKQKQAYAKALGLKDPEEEAE